MFHSPIKLLNGSMFVRRDPNTDFDQSEQAFYAHVIFN